MIFMLMFSIENEILFTFWTFLLFMKQTIFKTRKSQYTRYVVMIKDSI
jgi:hypothetical protein